MISKKKELLLLRKENQILSKFKLEGTILKNLNSKNSIDESIPLEVKAFKLDKHFINRLNYPFYAIVQIKKNENVQNDTTTFSALNIDFLETITIDMEEYKAAER